MLQANARGDGQWRGTGASPRGEYLRLEDVPEFDAPYSALGPGMRSRRPISPFHDMPQRFKKMFEKRSRPVIPYSPAVFTGAKREVLFRRRVVKSQAKPKTAPHMKPPVSYAAAGQLRHHLVSAEFWMGVIFGAGTRYITRAAMAAALVSESPADPATGLVACAFAGVVAGVAACAVRIGYRNAKVTNAKEKQKYWTRDMVASGLVGLIGGVVGGSVTNMGGYFGRAGSFAMGAITGGSYVIARAILREASNIRTLRDANNLARLAFEGAAFVFVGGLFGVVFAELLTVRDSVAAPANAEMAAPATPAYPMPMIVDPCGDAMCGMAVPVPAQMPVVYVPVQPPTVVVVKEKPLKVKKKVAAAKPCCHHRHKTKPKAVVKRDKPKPKPADSVVVVPPPPQIVFPIVAPPPAMMPVPAPVYINPCQFGECAPGCEDMSMLDLQGPCSGPNAASCVQRISFNEDGVATRVVLEQRFGSEVGPHFEYGAGNLRVEGPVWSRTPNSVPATGASGESPVSFVMPFVNSISATHPAPEYLPG